jgi:hypothetical protein
MTVKTLEGVEFIEWCRNRRWNTCGLQVGPAIKNDSGAILSRLRSSVHALGDEIQDSYQRRE